VLQQLHPSLGSEMHFRKSVLVLSVLFIAHDV